MVRAKQPPHPDPLPAGERESSSALASAVAEKSNASPKALAPSGRGQRAARAGEGAYRPKPSPRSIARAKTLRQQSTDAERKLWRALRAAQLGVRFRRQHPVEGYIADFAAPTQKLIIELDGGQHNDATHTARDAARTSTLEKSGWRVLRFWNNEVMENIDGVLRVIADALTRNA